MIVDDKDIVRRELKRLKIWGDCSGFTICKEATNGEEALDFIKDNLVDLVITDIRMPKVDGLELLRAIVESKRCPLVVLLSDFSDFTYARQGIIHGAFDFIPKPVNEDELTTLLLRAKLFLDQSLVEHKLTEKIDYRYIEAHQPSETKLNLEIIQELISFDSKEVMEKISQKVSQMSEQQEWTRNTFEELLESSITSILAKLLLEWPCLENYIDYDFFRARSILSNQTRSTLCNDYLNKIEELLRLLQTLRCNPSERGVIAEVCAYIRSHIEEEVSLHAISENLYVNKNYLSELFKQKTGMAFTEYVTKVKMERAKILLLKQEQKAFEIAERLGFKDTEYFSKVFKKYTLMTPTQFRNRKASSTK